jgi:hypothetical protein
MRFILTFLIFFSVLNGESGLLDVKWPKLKTLHQKSRSYPSDLEKKIENVSLPVYLPKSYIRGHELSIVSDKNFYFITVLLNGATVMVSGDKTYQQRIRSDKGDIISKIRAVNMKFVLAEGIMTTDFNRHGVNYSLLVECDSPLKDIRCKSEKFLRKLYSELTIVGGRR